MHSVNLITDMAGIVGGGPKIDAADHWGPRLKLFSRIYSAAITEMYTTRGREELYN